MAKPCDHVKQMSQLIPQIGGPPLRNVHAECALKQQGEMARFTVYDALFKKGLEGSIISNQCPVAHSGNWAACPFYDYPLK